MAHKNHRHPMALQAEVKKRLFAEGKIDEFGNRLDTGQPKPTPPPAPPASRPKMVTSGSTLVSKPLTAAPTRIQLSARELLEALPDSDLIAKAKTLNLDATGERETLIKALLDAGVEG